MPSRYSPHTQRGRNSAGNTNHVLENTDDAESRKSDEPQTQDATGKGVPPSAATDSTKPEKRGESTRRRLTRRPRKNVRADPAWADASHISGPTPTSSRDWSNLSRVLLPG